MPKIIENVREQLLLVAKKQICEQGYKSTTIRSVAAECGIAVGTVYNYFKSKDMLIASFILDDWLECVRSIGEHPKENKESFLAFVHSSLCIFAKRHVSLFKDKDAAKVFNVAFSQRHKMLRSQLAELILPISPDVFTAEFVAEAMLTWTMAGKDFSEIFSLLPSQIK